MSATNFPSGQWTGFYVYGRASRRYPMDLRLEFRNGVLTGEGNDGVGPFVIRGHYSPQEGGCRWVKTYVGRHSVEYTGYREQKGIWGTWTLPGFKGGFHIWPVGDGASADESKDQAEEEVPFQAAPTRPLQPALASMHGTRAYADAR